MKRFMKLLLDVWREGCRHIRIEEAAERIAPLLRTHIPVSALIVRRVSVAGSCVETVATGLAGGAGPAGEGYPAHSPLRSDELEWVLAWAQDPTVVAWPGPAATEAGHVPWPVALVPTGLAGPALLGPLRDEQGVTGVLILAAETGADFDDLHAELMRELLDPFSVALANDRGVREIITSREAAEADRASLLTRLGREAISDTVVGSETGLRVVMERVKLVARSDVPVLLLGETGSGKEVIARALHQRSPRATGPFLRVNCGAIPPELIDSELFGHERGSFTGAVAMRKGWFERADGGTLFLDEVAELPLPAQVRLLRILQDGSFERVGGEKPLHVDVRVVAATNQDLPGMVSQGRYRDDLWYRLAVFPIRLPALRDRPQDMPALAAHFALRAARRFGLPVQMPTLTDIDLLLGYAWPGNIRELASVIDRAAILGDGRGLQVAVALGTTGDVEASKPAGSPLGSTGVPDEAGAFLELDEAIRRHVAAALLRTGGRIEGPQGAAQLLGINPHTLRARMRKLGVDWAQYRK